MSIYIDQSLLREPVPADLFELRLFAIARRWWKRDLQALSDLCNRMQATKVQAAGAEHAYFLEQERQGGPKFRVVNRTGEFWVDIPAEPRHVDDIRAYMAERQRHEA